MIHDKTDRLNWTRLVDDWEEEFDHRDVVISMDPQQRLGEDTHVVHSINLKQDAEYVEHFGLFWNRREANRYAKRLDEDCNGE